MNGWTAIVPLKAEGARKTRLSGHLSEIAREQLSETLFRHVIRTLRSCPSITRVVSLSDGPAMIDGLERICDSGRGLNAELQDVIDAIRADHDAVRLLILHADLPLLEVADVEALARAAGGGVAIAPDRAGAGTNALAIGAERPFALCFGPESFARHRAQAPYAEIITGRPGLALDVDTPADLRAAVALGFMER